MAKTQLLQGAFTSGELTPDLDARTDFTRYANGCRTLKNFWVQAHGGASKRPGFMLAGQVPGEATLVPFVFNTEQSYCLVFGDGWLRICTEDGFIADDKGTTIEIPSPYTIQQAKLLSWAQSGDILFLACRGVHPQKLRRLGHNNWQFQPMSFIPDVAAPTWQVPSVEYETVTEYEFRYPAGSLIQSNGKAIKVHLYAQTAKQVPINIEGYAVFYNRATNSAGVISPAVRNTRYTYYVTASSKDTGRESLVSIANNITGPASNNWQVGDYIRVKWAAVANAAEYRVYKAQSGGTPGLLAVTTALYVDDNNILPKYNSGMRVTKSPFVAQKSEEGLGREYPGVVCFFEQRLVFASSISQPQTLWLSDSGDYQNFSRHTPVQADNSIEITIASNEVSPLQWMVPMRSLMAGGSGTEWEITSRDGGAFSAGNARAIPQSRRGSAQMRALVVGSTILHVTRSGREIRNFQYDFGTDSFTGQDKGILASHLFEKYRIVNWDYQPLPHSIIWAVREDGVLLGLTYNAEHEVHAWHRHDTQGKFKAVCALPCPSEDKLFALVERNGKYCVEYMAAPFIGGNSMESAIYLDSALQLNNAAPVSAVSGLEHLEGLEITLLADGKTCQHTVTDGRVGLDTPARNILAGLSYSSELETMPLEAASAQGSSSGRKKKVSAINIHLKNSLGAEVGTDFEHLEAIKWPEKNGVPALYSGVQRVVTGTLANNLITACIRSDEPYPLTVLAVIPEIAIY